MINWVRQSVGLAVFGFINLVLFIALSSPFGMVMDTISDESVKMNVDAKVIPFLDTFRTIFGVVFVLSMFGLAIWFFLSSHKFEAESY